MATEEELRMKTERMTKAVCHYLNRKGYDYDVKMGNIEGYFDIDSAVNEVSMLIMFRPEGILSYASIYTGRNVDEHTAKELMTYLMKANYDLLNGNFDMDPIRGEIRYKVFLPTEGVEAISMEQAEALVEAPISSFNHYGDGIVDILKGSCDAETAFNRYGDGVIALLRSLREFEGDSLAET